MDLSDKMSNYVISQIIYPIFWDKFNWKKYNLSEQNFIEIKFLNEDASSFSNQINQLPNSSGGIYLFYIKFDKITNFSNTLVYIGRAIYTDNENLRVRCRSYFTKFKREKERVMISKMFYHWDKYLHLKFIQVDNNETIKKLEEELINTFIPHFNYDIPNQTFKNAVRAL